MFDIWGIFRVFDIFAEIRENYISDCKLTKRTKKVKDNNF